MGVWLLHHVTQEDSTGAIQIADVFHKGLIMYSADGYISAILIYSGNYSDTPELDVGYCGHYEINLEEKYVSHLRDVIAINSDNKKEICVIHTGPFLKPVLGIEEISMSGLN